MTKESPETLRNGDLVLYVPADGSRGSGPFYLDNAERYGDDENRVAVSLLVSGPVAWTFDRPKNEVVPVGHVEAEPGDRLGNSFTIEALRRFAPAIREARGAFYERFPNFEDGRSSAHISELGSGMKGFISAEALPPIDNITDEDILDIRLGSKDMPVHDDEELIVYAAPQADSDVYVEPTAIMGRDFRLMHAVIEGDEDNPSTSGYFAAPHLSV